MKFTLLKLSTLLHFKTKNYILTLLKLNVYIYIYELETYTSSQERALIIIQYIMRRSLHTSS